MTHQIKVLTFPHDDVAFRAHVEGVQTWLGHWDAEAVEAEIRRAYPAAMFRRAEEFGRIGLEPETWYGYRDGSVRPPGDTGTWWESEDLPRTVIDADGGYVEANEAAGELFGVRSSVILQGRAGDFTRHEPMPEVRDRLFARLAETGVLHSTAVVVRPDGTEVPIEFHTERLDGSELFVTVMRPV